MPKQLVLMDHDGGVDDYLSTALLMTMDHVQVLGIVVTPADCYIKPAVSATRKLLDLMGRSDVPVAESTVRGLNPFPRIFRRDSFTIDHFPILNENDEIRAPLVPENGQTFLARALREAPEPVALLVTGPAAKQDPVLVQAAALPKPWEISVDVLNGAGDINRTRQVASEIQSLAYTIKRVGKADRFDYPRTAVYYEQGGRLIAIRLARQLGVVAQPLPGGSNAKRLVVIVGPQRGPG